MTMALMEEEEREEVGSDGNRMIRITMTPDDDPPPPPPPPTCLGGAGENLCNEDPGRSRKGPRGCQLARPRPDTPRHRGENGIQQKVWKGEWIGGCIASCRESTPVVL